MHCDHIDVVTGGQYGSEGKGAVAAALVKRRSYDLLIRVAGPNAGHTVIDQTGTPRALRQIPAAGILDPNCVLYIAPGSEVDLDVLRDDIAVYDAAGSFTHGRLYIDPEATVISPYHHVLENSPNFGAQGSTRKGVGAARSERIMRRARRVFDVNHAPFDELGVIIGAPAFAKLAMVEGTQGYWLGNHAGLYPYCTSSDCRAVDFLAMAGCTYDAARAVVVFRSYPIRIAGNSGPLDDETTWEEIGVPAEFTTVTKKMRRVGRWEPRRLTAAIHQNRIGSVWPSVAMTFVDYLSKDEAEQASLARQLLGPYSDQLMYVGNGPGQGFWT